MAITWTQVAVSGYLAGMLHFILTTADQARNDTDDDPLTAMLRHNSVVRAVAAVVIIALSPLWPINAAAAVYWWCATRWRAATDRPDTDEPPP